MVFTAFRKIGWDVGMMGLRVGPGMRLEGIIGVEKLEGGSEGVSALGGEDGMMGMEF